MKLDLHCHHHHHLFQKCNYKKTITLINSQLEHCSQINGSGRPLYCPTIFVWFFIFLVQFLQYLTVHLDCFPICVSNLFLVQSCHMLFNKENVQWFLHVNDMQHKQYYHISIHSILWYPGFVISTILVMSQTPVYNMYRIQEILSTIIFFAFLYVSLKKPKLFGSSEQDMFKTRRVRPHW